VKDKMTDEGYLQIKVRELIETVNRLDTKLEQDKTTIQKLLSDMEKKTHELKTQRDREEYLTNSLKDVMKFHEDNYKKMENRILGELRLLFVSLKKQCRYDIADYMTAVFLLEEYLSQIGILNIHELLEVIDKQHDEIREKMIKESSLEHWDSIKIGLGTMIKEMKG
jgi:hypothetical protein